MARLSDRFSHAVLQLSSTSKLPSARPPSRPFYATPDYQKLKADVDSAGSATLPTDRQIQAQIDLLDRQRAAMTPAFQTSRGKVGALTYQLEQIPESDKSAKASKLKELNDAKAETYERRIGPRRRRRSSARFNYDDLNGMFTGIMAQKAALVAQRGDQSIKPAKDAQNALDDFVKEQPARLGLGRSYRAFERRA